MSDQETIEALQARVVRLERAVAVVAATVTRQLPFREIDDPAGVAAVQEIWRESRQQVEGEAAARRRGLLERELAGMDGKAA